MMMANVNALPRLPNINGWCVESLHSIEEGGSRKVGSGRRTRFSRRAAQARISPTTTLSNHRHYQNPYALLCRVLQPLLSEHDAAWLVHDIHFNMENLTLSELPQGGGPSQLTSGPTSGPLGMPQLPPQVRDWAYV